MKFYDRLFTFVALLGLDLGCADLIASGKIKVKQGIEATAYTGTGLLFNDGSELQTDVVIYA